MHIYWFTVLLITLFFLVTMGIFISSIDKMADLYFFQIITMAKILCFCESFHSYVRSLSFCMAICNWNFIQVDPENNGRN